MKRLLTLLVISATLGACGDNNASTSNGMNNVAPDAGMTDGGGAEDVGTTTDGGTTPDGGTSPDMAVPDDAIETTGGPVTGTTTRGITSYKGIPYVAAPVGDLRLRPPQAHGGWDGVLEATDFGPPCPQRDLQTGTDFGEEDCLTLNIWAPEDAADAPVMVFIHGGAFVQGQSSTAIYDGETLAQQGVIVATINYRLGALGFLATESLAEESGDDSAGNYGFLDQIAALEWVQENIGAFGGSPDNVTIFGESAGGVSVCAHLGSPKSEGLFARGIIESGSGCYGWQRLRTALPTSAPAVDTGEAYVAETGCSDATDELACLRDADPLDLVAAQYELGNSLLGLPPFGPTIDGVTLTDNTFDLFEDGSATDRPIITGSNADEGRTFTQATPVPSVMAYRTLVRSALGVTLGDQVLDVYPAEDFDSPKEAWSQLVGDVSFVCPALRFAETASGGDEPAYHYHFTKTLDGAGAAFGSVHGLELPYVFGTYDTFPAYRPTENDVMLSEDMVAAWTTFATDGTPTTDPVWPVATSDDTPSMIFDVPLSTADVIKDGRCAALVDLGLIR